MSPPRHAVAVVLLALFAVAGTAEAARTYKWVDEDGVTHYSQYPPPAGEVQVIEPSIGVPTDTTGSADSAGDTAESSGTAKGGETGDGPKTMEAYCQQLREQAQMLASDRDVRVRQDDGTLQPLAGDARTRKRAEVQQQIEQHCS